MEIGTLDGKPIYLEKKNDKSLWLSKVRLGDHKQIVSLGSLKKFKPYSELLLYPEFE